MNQDEVLVNFMFRWPIQHQMIECLEFISEQAPSFENLEDDQNHQENM